MSSSDVEVTGDSKTAFANLSEADSAAGTNAAGPLERVAATLACPACHSRLTDRAQALLCDSCGRSFGISTGILDLRLDGERPDQVQAWTDHWTPTRGLLERLLSFYRMRVCARLVRTGFSRYMPQRGVFVEAGSGTAETSSLIEKRSGDRVLVAQDFVPDVLRMSHPVIDVCVSADIFAMPFMDSSLDGIWNVGVLEHYTHAEIDRAMREFLRVLRPRGRVVIFWPATNSIPQKCLVAGGAMVGLLTGRGIRHRFHPPEISQLRSNQEGHDILRRNGFRPVAVTGGLAGLIAWKTVVGEKQR
jgi:SAM-dependent methyltransferase